MFRPDAIGANVTVISVDGGLNDQTIPGVEVSAPPIIYKTLFPLICLGEPRQSIHRGMIL